MDYTVPELIHNQSFRRMVKGQASAEEVRLWNRWIEASDANRQKAKKAIAEIAGFEFKDPEYPDISAEWSLLRQVTTQAHDKNLRYYKKSRRINWLYRVAAILLVGVFLGVGLYFYSNSDWVTSQVKQIIQKKTIITGSNEQKTIAFSNGSKIILNSNSKLTYQLGVLHNQIIKVVLHGEAYFDAVKEHSKKGRVFTVYTPDGIIRDIGTKFMVTVRNHRSRVILQDGKVKVNLAGQSPNDTPVDLKKGEMLSFDRKKVINKRMINPTFYTSWATGSMHFDQTPVRKIADFIEQRFGVNVKIENPRLDTVRVDGNVYFHSLSGLVRSLSKGVMVPAYRSRDGKTVYIGKVSSKN